MATLAVTRRLDLTDEQWARLEPLLPVPTRSGRPSAWTKRQLIDGIRWRVRVGAPWRDVPDCYGSWRAVYALFRWWQRAGAWAQIVTALQTRADAAGLITWDVSVDSTIARAHQHAAGARRHPSQQQEPPGGLSAEPDDHALGRSRGGLTTKIHLACEQGQKVLSLIVTAGQRGDSPQFQAVLDGLRRRGIACTIPEPADQQQHRKNRGRRPRFSLDDYRARHAVECGINRLKTRRRHQIRQTRRPLRSHPPHRRHQRLAPDLTLRQALALQADMDAAGRGGGVQFGGGDDGVEGDVEDDRAR